MIVLEGSLHLWDEGNGMVSKEFQQIKTASYKKRQWDILLKHINPKSGRWSESHLKQLCFHMKAMGVAESKIASQILNCNKPDYGLCGSIMCKRCCDRLADKMGQRWKKKIKPELQTYSITILGGLCPIEPEAMKEKVWEMRNGFQTIRKTTPIPFIIDGFVEYELVDTQSYFSGNAYNESNQKKRNFVHKHIGRMERDSPKVIPHLHGILQLSQNEMKPWFEKRLKQRFGYVNEVMIKRMPFSGQTMDEAIQNWSRYILKSSTQKGWYRQKFQYKNHFDAKWFAPTDTDQQFIDYATLIKFISSHNIVSGDNNKGLQMITSNKNSDPNFNIADYV
jgi:hypothetical protein